MNRKETKEWLEAVRRSVQELIQKKSKQIVKKTFWAGETTDGVMFDTLKGSGKEMSKHVYKALNELVYN